MYCLLLSLLILSLNGCRPREGMVISYSSPEVTYRKVVTEDSEGKVLETARKAAQQLAAARKAAQQAEATLQTEAALAAVRKDVQQTEAALQAVLSKLQERIK